MYPCVGPFETELCCELTHASDLFASLIQGCSYIWVVTYTELIVWPLRKVEKCSSTCTTASNLGWWKLKAYRNEFSLLQFCLSISRKADIHTEKKIKTLFDVIDKKNNPKPHSVPLALVYCKHPFWNTEECRSDFARLYICVYIYIYVCWTPFCRVLSVYHCIPGKRTFIHAEVWK